MRVQTREAHWWQGLGGESPCAGPGRVGPVQETQTHCSAGETTNRAQPMPARCQWADSGARERSYAGITRVPWPTQATLWRALRSASASDLAHHSKVPQALGLGPVAS